MKPVTQEIVANGKATGGVRGDCFKAALASVLERELHEVPHFVQLEHDLGYWHLDIANRWLAKQGYQFRLAERYFTEHGPAKWFINRKQQWVERGVNLPGYWLMTVRSKVFPGAHHVVVAYEDRIVHDPSPHATENAYRRKAYIFDGFVTQFVVINPAAIARAT